MQEKINKISYQDNYQFGLELECGFDHTELNNAELSNKLASIGFRRDRDYHDTGARIDGIEAVTNGVVNTDNINNHVNSFIELAEELHYRTDPMQAGLHINISREDGDFKNRTLINIITLFYSLEDVFYNIVHSDRQYNRYSGKLQEMGRYDNIRLFEEFRQDLFELEELEKRPFNELRAKLRELKGKYFDFNGKFNGLAIHKLEDAEHRRCLEFRLFDGKLENLKFYIELTQKLLKFSEKNTVFQVKNLINKVNEKPKSNQAQYLLKRIGFTAKEAVKLMK